MRYFGDICRRKVDERKYGKYWRSDCQENIPYTQPISDERQRPRGEALSGETELETNAKIMSSCWETATGE